LQERLRRDILGAHAVAGAPVGEGEYGGVVALVHLGKVGAALRARRRRRPLGDDHTRSYLLCSVNDGVRLTAP